VAPLTSTPAPGANLRRAARQLGALNGAIGLGLAIASAKGLNELAHRQFSTGTWTLVAVLGSRWLLALLMDEWSELASRQIRDHWRANLLAHFLRPRRQGERGRGDLALAVERASDGPGLLQLQASAQAGILGIAVIFWAAGWLCCLIAVALLLLSVPLYLRAGRRSEALSRDYHERRSFLEARQLEILHHTPELRALGAVDYGADEIAAISDSEHHLAMRAIRVALGSSLVTEFLSGVSVGLVAMVVGFGLLGGRLSLFHALVAVLVTGELFLHVRRYGAEFHRREEAEAALALLDIEEPPPGRFFEALIVAHNLVSLPDARPVTLNVDAGNRILVSGPSGSGKTTLLYTLLGWRDPLEGTLQRSHVRVGVVSVESELLSASLWDNLTLGVAIEEDVVREQLRLLGLLGERFSDMELSLLPDGRGLSDGERVRLVLARCLLANPKLVVLDDVAGVLDAQNRTLVARALSERRELAIIEATVDRPLMGYFSKRIDLTR
jgi:ABC-type transport system involved in cytochrome bd biosynthesis fused ATPase/permease subunit